MEEDQLPCTPPELLASAQCAEKILLPAKSKKKYDTAYNNFMEWKEKYNNAPISEHVLMAYFNHLSKQMAPTSLISIYSRLKSTLYLNDGVDTSSYKKIAKFLTRNAEGYQPTQTKTLTELEIKTFLEKAPDDAYLDIKVAMIFGLMGGLRTAEMVKVLVKDIQQHGDDCIYVHVPWQNVKNKQAKGFAILGDYLSIVKKYIDLRPQETKTDRFFINYQKGRCTIQNIGKGKLATYPRLIAKFLNLEEPEKYTGHCYRHTSTSVLANAGASMTEIKDHGGWTGDKVAKRYIKQSINYKKKTGNLISNAVKNASRFSISKDTKEQIESNVVHHTINSQPSTSFQKPDEMQCIEINETDNCSSVKYVNQNAKLHISSENLNDYIIEESYDLSDSYMDSYLHSQSQLQFTEEIYNDGKFYVVPKTQSNRFQFKQPSIHYKFENCTVTINN